MKLAFIDMIKMEYTAGSPWHIPMGGTQAALCYLSIELAQRGHQVSIVNRTSKPGYYRGVYIPEGEIGRTVGFLGQQDAIIATRPFGLPLRRALPRGPTAPLLLCWIQHAADQRAVSLLENSEERDAWDHFALVSLWQAHRYQVAFGIDHRRISIMRNAIAPFFAEPPWTARTVPKEDPILVYTSTPFRGLDLLLDAFPLMRRAFPALRLRLFSSMKVYGLSDEPYRPLYERAQSMPGVEWVGSIDQPRLAREMAGADMLAYPSTFAETACIAAMEAMASGLLIATTDLGALPETLAGFGQMMPKVDDQNRAGAAAAYAELVVGMLRRAIADPAGHAARMSEQVQFARAVYSWPQRAKQWADWIAAGPAATGSAAIP